MTERPAHIKRCELHGVPVFHADGAQSLSGGIVFRVGQADETLVGRGLTHLVEHLVLEPLVREHRTANGCVGMTTTSFQAAGEPDEVRDFLNAAVRSLASLPFDRLDTEIRVLRTESQRRGGSPGLAAHGMRFGPVAYGVVDAPELGLRTVTPERVDAWRRRWFTRDNAALWLSGPPPHGIDLSPLPRGERIPPPAAEPCPYRWPVWYPGFDAYIAVSLLAPHSMALWAAHAILHERLYDRLRTREGRSYEVTVDYDRLSADTATILVLTDALPEETENVRDAVSVELHRLAASGAADEELDEIAACASVGAASRTSGRRSPSASRSTRSWPARRAPGRRRTRSSRRSAAPTSAPRCARPWTPRCGSCPCTSGWRTSASARFRRAPSTRSRAGSSRARTAFRRVLPATCCGSAATV